MRQFLLASTMMLAASFLTASGAQAAPMLGLTVQSGGDSSFQSVTLGSAGGSYNFAQVRVGNFTANNIGTQLFSPDYIDLATFDLSSLSGGTRLCPYPRFVRSSILPIFGKLGQA